MPLCIPDVGMEKPANRHPEMLMTIDPKQPLKGACSPHLREAQNQTAFHSRIRNNGSTLVKDREDTCCLPPQGLAEVKWGVLPSHEAAYMDFNTGSVTGWCRGEGLQGWGIHLPQAVKSLHCPLSNEVKGWGSLSFNPMQVWDCPSNSGLMLKGTITNRYHWKQCTESIKRKFLKEQ